LLLEDIAAAMAALRNGTIERELFFDEVSDLTLYKDEVKIVDLRILMKTNAGD
jgi:hypothetical protein